MVDLGDADRGVPVGLVVVLVALAAGGYLLATSGPLPSFGGGAADPGCAANASQRVATEFGQWHDERVGDARSVADGLPTGDTDRMRRYLDRRLAGETTPNATSIHVVNLSTKVVVASTGGYTGRSLENLPGSRTWVSATKRVESAGRVESPRIVGTGIGMTGEPLAVFAAPTDGQDVVVYVVSLDGFRPDGRSAPGRVTYVVDNRKGGIVYDSTGVGETDGAFFERYPYRNVVADARANRSNDSWRGEYTGLEPATAFRASVPGEFADSEYVAGAANVEGTTYTAVVHVPREHAEAVCAG